MYAHFYKRIIDFVVALITLLLIGWFLIIITIWLYFANKGAGAFFCMPRPGKDGKIFKEIHKGNDSRKEFFDKIIDVVTLLGGDLNDAL